MAGANEVWGIELGQAALRAIKLRAAGDKQVELVAYDVVEHEKILSQPDADPDALIAASLEKFVGRNDLQKAGLVLGVAGQQTFARFCKLPPVDDRRIPDIVRFEATQQIPFDMDDVVWDYEVFRTEDAPDVEVGIFAMRNDLVRKQIEHYTSRKLTPTVVQTIPSALYNYLRYDGAELPDNQAAVIVNVGAQNTDLVVVGTHTAWFRNIQTGGNTFTEALIGAFKLSFAKAESLKRSAASSKYARQIFQAMRPVFSDLVAEIQRSLGFYSSTHRDIEIVKVIAVGNAFKLPGLQKYLENNLTVEGGVEKLEKFNNLITDGVSDLTKFNDELVSFAAAYGLALQGLNKARIKANLLPPEIARTVRWKKKQPMFAIAAGLLGVAALLPWTRHTLDARALASSEDTGRQAQAIVQQAKSLQSKLSQAQTNTSDAETKIGQVMELFVQRPLMPRLLATVLEALPKLDADFLSASADRIADVIRANPGRLGRTQRKQIFIESFDVEYKPDIGSFVPPPLGGGRPGGGGAMIPGERGGGGMGMNPMLGGGNAPPPPADVGGGGAGGGFYVTLRGRTTFGESQSAVLQMLTADYVPSLLKLGQRVGLGFHILPDPNTGDQKTLATPYVRPYFNPQSFNTGSPGFGAQPVTPGGTTPEAPKNIDPVTGEEMKTDWYFEIGFKVAMGDAPQEAAQPGQDQGQGQQP